MSLLEYLGLGLELWTAIGLLGLTVSLIRRERRRLREGIAALIGVWVIYITILIVLSIRQPEQRIPAGTPVCYGRMCFTVERGEAVPGLSPEERARLVRVVIRVENHGKSPASEPVTATLRDAQGRTWYPAAAISGNPLDHRLPPGNTLTSEPVFRIANDATGLVLILHHSPWSRHRLVLGDPESLWHKPRVLALGP